MHPKRIANPAAKRPRARHKDNDALVKAAWDAGWWCEMAKGGYIHVKPPTGNMIVIESTPSDHHSIKNTRSRLRRAGLNV